MNRTLYCILIALLSSLVLSSCTSEDYSQISSSLSEGEEAQADCPDCCPSSEEEQQAAGAAADDRPAASCTLTTADLRNLPVFAPPINDGDTCWVGFATTMSGATPSGFSAELNCLGDNPYLYIRCEMTFAMGVPPTASVGGYGTFNPGTDGGAEACAQYIQRALHVCGQLGKLGAVGAQ